MVRCGFSPDDTVSWSENILTHKLQEIVAKHQKKFNGEPVHAWDVET